MLQIASVQAQIMGLFSPNMDRDGNLDIMNTGVFACMVHFTSNLTWNIIAVWNQQTLDI